MISTAYRVKVSDLPGGVLLENEISDLQYRMGTGLTVNNFYYDCVLHKCRWNYCDKEYFLGNFEYDFVKLAKDLSGFCGFNRGCEQVDFYNSVGELICSYRYGDEAEFPPELGIGMIQYLFVTNDIVWWIYEGKLRSFKRYVGTERIEIGFHSNMYIKEMSSVKDSLYNAYGEKVYFIDYFPFILKLGETPVKISTDKAKPLILERYNLIAVCEKHEYYYTTITLYDLQGCRVAVIPLPENTVAFHDIQLLEHTDIPVISCFEKLPDTSRYFNNGIARSIRPNMPMKLRWYELLPDEKGRLTLYKSGELYQGFRPIDPFTIKELHVRW